jgi:hypothetical protein
LYRATASQCAQPWRASQCGQTFTLRMSRAVLNMVLRLVCPSHPGAAPTPFVPKSRKGSGGPETASVRGQRLASCGPVSCWCRQCARSEGVRARPRSPLPIPERGRGRIFVPAPRGTDQGRSGRAGARHGGTRTIEGSEADWWRPRPERCVPLGEGRQLADP